MKKPRRKKRETLTAEEKRAVAEVIERQRKINAMIDALPPPKPDLSVRLFMWVVRWRWAILLGLTLTGLICFVLPLVPLLFALPALRIMGGVASGMSKKPDSSLGMHGATTRGSHAPSMGRGR